MLFCEISYFQGLNKIYKSHQKILFYPIHYFLRHRVSLKQKNKLNIKTNGRCHRHEKQLLSEFLCPFPVLYLNSGWVMWNDWEEIVLNWNTGLDGHRSSIEMSEIESRLHFKLYFKSLSPNLKSSYCYPGFSYLMFANIGL